MMPNSSRTSGWKERPPPGIEEVMDKTHYRIGRIGSLEDVRMINADDAGRITVTQKMIRAVIEEALKMKRESA